ncbi:MAG: pectin esterase [Bacteroidales bacterium]|nr:pectin esterase [Bacteroidales bacterium]
MKKVTNQYLIFFFTFLFTKISFAAGTSIPVTVSLDGTGDFTTIQEAVNSARDFSDARFVIFIKNGIYREKLVVPSWKTIITLIGENADSTIIVFDDYSGKDGINTFTSYTVLVQGNDFYAENITFQNSAGPVGQAVALHIEADRCTFRNCRFLGNQDTMYAAGEGSRQYYYNCYIEGTTDFIFGAATALFEECTIHSKKNSYITAASTTKDTEYGFVFMKCKLTADSAISKVYLGRPWRDYAKVVFLHCELDNHIVPAGWHNWSKSERELTAFYAEYKNSGNGSDIANRVAWSKHLSDDEASCFTKVNILSFIQENEDQTPKWYDYIFQSQ